MSADPQLNTESASQETYATSNRALELQQLVARLRVDAKTGESRPYPTLNTADDLLVWTRGLQKVFKAAKIPKDRWPEAGLLFLRDSGRELQLKVLLERQRIELTAAGQSGAWDWAKFLETLKELLVSFEEPDWFGNFEDQHKDSIRFAAKTLIGLGAVALTPAAGLLALNALGFTAGGVVGGSIAAGMQSTLYGGLTTGTFSTCQSIAASVAVPAIGSLGSGLGAVLTGIGILTKTSGESGSDEEENENTREGSPKCREKSSNPSPMAGGCTCEEK
ncbi:hypothetical protein CPB83DRAFT_855347 [Crepidotus variabilis]|uniref:Uncharacterized protein n=1 Tax=Crepidotus variabilis TaxID=179855 RepID=A0A9P6EE91_9AGAR|nr:hypothetical protein CPB83DRAFT_855347 [Crepidotus variabilis]